MPNERQIPESLRLILREAQREPSPEEKEAARRFVLGHTTVAEYLGARRQDSGR
jgi:hypothetical protein